MPACESTERTHWASLSIVCAASRGTALRYRVCGTQCRFPAAPCSTREAAGRIPQNRNGMLSAGGAAPARALESAGPARTTSIWRPFASPSVEMYPRRPLSRLWGSV